MVLFPWVILPTNPFFATRNQTEGRYKKALVCLGLIKTTESCSLGSYLQFLKMKTTRIYDIHRTVKSLSLQNVKLFFFVK